MKLSFALFGHVALETLEESMVYLMHYLYLIFLSFEEQ